MMSNDNNPSPSPQTSEIDAGRRDVYISYARQDLDFVARLDQYLTGRGISTWFDQDNRETVDHWRTSIVAGIRDCKVFVLVLSPDAAASVNVRKEVDLAERFNKTIMPVMWRQTDIPVAMEYQLAGIHSIDFQEEASEENFTQLVDVIDRLARAAVIDDATTAGEVEQAPVPADRERIKPTRGSRVNPQAVGRWVISTVITRLVLNQEERDLVKGELRWLFSAMDHFLKVREGSLPPITLVGVDIPPGAELGDGANNRIGVDPDDLWLQIIEEQVEEVISRIIIYRTKLEFELLREAKMGVDGKGNVALQNSIRTQYQQVWACLEELSELAQYLYGVLVTSPREIVKLIE